MMLNGTTVAATLIASCCEAHCGAEDASVTFTVNGNVPDCVGAPATTPVEAFRLKPLGRVPEGMLQLYGEVPPLAASVAL